MVLHGWKNTIKNGDKKQSIIILYGQSLISREENNVINMNLNHSNKYCLYYLKAKI